MPRRENQAVRVLTARFKPGDKTVFHTHRSPVPHILEGVFTLELEGRAPVVVKAGASFRGAAEREDDRLQPKHN